MIPEKFIIIWRKQTNWQTLAMVEQDLVICHALVCLYSDPIIQDTLVFRGGTALNMLFIKPASRYSEDIHFVQKRPEPIGATLDKIRELLEPWLGEPKRKITERSAKLIYRYQDINGNPAKLKIEINTTEHFQVLPLRIEPFSMESEWFNGQCEIITYELEELMATKLRALYQRKKGRDLFDMWYIFSQELANLTQVIEIFQKYCAQDKIIITKTLFLQNMELKRTYIDFQTDMHLLLPDQTAWNFEEAFEFVINHVLSKLP